MRPEPSVILLLGGPGAGKGTQGHLLGEALGVPHVSSGELVRQRAPIEAQESVSRGELLPDDDVARLVFARLAQPDMKNGVILDGFPRTLSQARQLDEWLRQRKAPPPTAIYLDVPTDELLERLTGRQFEVHRTDDNPHAAVRRLAVFAGEMPPVIHEYERRGLLKRVDGHGSVDTVHERVMQALH
jgi:adenylate kinase